MSVFPATCVESGYLCLTHFILVLIFLPCPMKLFFNSCLNSYTDSLRHIRGSGKISVHVASLSAAFAVAVFASGCSDAASAVSEEDFTQYVNPMIGTDFTGNTYPGAQVPFGMVQLSPDNGLPGWDRISGYFYPDSTIAGGCQTHLCGTGGGDL